MNQITGGLICIVAGILAVLGAALNRRLIVGEGKLLARRFGVAVARILTAVVGVVLTGLGIGLLLGWV